LSDARRRSVAARSWNAAVPTESELHHAKRREVLRLAAQSFNRQGYHATTLDSLAKKLGVTKAALYHYFPNKTGLLKACFDELMIAAFANLEQAKAQGRNGREKLRLTFSGYLRDIIAALTVAVVVLEDDALDPADRAAAVAQRDRFERELRDLVKEGIQDGSVARCNPKLVVLTLLGAVNWVPRWFKHQGEWTTEELAEAMSEVLDRAISSKPSAALSTKVRRSPRSAAPTSGDLS
jgi:TetR/AcrR family transcriptional regulator